MANVIGNGVTLLGLTNPDDYVTVNLASGITENDEGKALTWDASAANQMKLAGDGDNVDAYLDKVEKRESEGILVGSALPRGFVKLPLKAEDTAAIGDYIIGAGNGEVKKATATSNVYPNNLVLQKIVEVGTGYVVAKLRG